MRQRGDDRRAVRIERHAGSRVETLGDRASSYRAILEHLKRTGADGELLMIHEATGDVIVRERIGGQPDAGEA